ncbi:MAG: hypothetical protein FWD92_00120 [Methanomassiliicoccaceae archaeon]|nr:hypothetical protein [Methanomassiliicoccaceae archaeon]
MSWNFATTLIGSLPYDDAEHALDKILSGKITCPAWPQLPALGFTESMYVQTGCRLPGVNIDEEAKRITVNTSSYDATDIYTAILSDDVSYFTHPEKYHKGLYEFLNRDLSKFKAVKGQVTGPISEGLQIQDENGKSVIYDEAYSELIIRTVNMTAKWQYERLSKQNKNVIIFFDEPSLSLLGTPFASISNDQAVKWINESMEGLGCSIAIHCCGNTDWALVLRTNIDILSFDAYSYAHTIAMFPDEVSAFLKKGGTLSWGIVPSSDDAIASETADSLVKRLKESIAALVRKGVSEDLMIKQSMLTPQCGLGPVEPKSADKALDMLYSVSKTMKEHYGV